MRPQLKRLLGVTLLLFCSFALAAAENTADSELLANWQIGFWSGGGSAVNGSTKDTQVLVTGIRMSKRVTGLRASGWMRGSLEYVVEVIPAFVIFQSNTVYGLDVTPFLWKWTFTGNKKVAPFFELGAGMLFTAADVPERTSKLNFTPQGGIGLQISVREQQAATLIFRYMHISNGGLHRPNPGINSLQILGGYQWSFY